MVSAGWVLEGVASATNAGERPDKQHESAPVDMCNLTHYT